MQHGVDVEFTLAGPDLAERDPLRVAVEPGRLMIEGGGTLFQRPDAEQHIERLALAT
jgi:hypothetical protein